MLDQINFSMSQMEQDQKDMDTLFSTFTENIENPQSRNFYQDDNVVLEDLSKQKQKIVNDNNVIQKKKKEDIVISSTQKLKQEIFLQMFHIEDLSSQMSIKLVS